MYDLVNYLKIILKVFEYVRISSDYLLSKMPEYHILSICFSSTLIKL